MHQAKTALAICAIDTFGRRKFCTGIISPGEILGGENFATLQTLTLKLPHAYPDVVHPEFAEFACLSQRALFSCEFANSNSISKFARIRIHFL